MNHPDEEFDYVIVGGGSAGCLLANRLSESGQYRVCMLEAGPPDRSPWIRVPLGFAKTLKDPKLIWAWKTEPGENIDGRAIFTPQGRTLGGSSAINGMIYNRGQAADYDEWAALGNTGWSHAEVLPYFRRSERWLGVRNAEYRGATGALPVTEFDLPDPVCDAFIAGAVGSGMHRNDDYNSHGHQGVGFYQRTILSGRRVSAARAFLKPAMNRPNLSVRTSAVVQSIVFRDRRAVGVAWRDADGESHLMRAKEEVILSAGAVNSPALLQRSGVGPAELLSALGVTPVLALESVGRGLQDHYAVRTVVRARNAVTLNDRSRGMRLVREVARWGLHRPSMLGQAPAFAFAFCSGDGTASRSNFQVTFTPASNKEGLIGVLDDFPGLTCGVFQQRPTSAGYVMARSLRVEDSPKVQPNYLGTLSDRQAVVAGVRQAHRLLKSPQLAPFVDGWVRPAGDASTMSDEQVLAFSKQNGVTAYHLIGTCRMGSADDPSTVVDPSLRVHGLQGIRVVDASVMPSMTSGNTYAPTLMIAEKAADLIRGA